MRDLRFDVRAEAPDCLELAVYDVVGKDPWTGEGVSAKDVLTALSGFKGSTIRVRINSGGGSAFDGIAIYNLLKEHPARVEIDVDGLAASAASVIACAGDTVRVAASALLMIHRASLVTGGNAGELREAVTVLEKLDSQMAELYSLTASKRGRMKSADEFLSLMSATTWMTASEAIENGLADEMTAAMQIAASLDGLEPPTDVLARRDALAAANEETMAETNEEQTALGELLQAVEETAEPVAEESAVEPEQTDEGSEPVTVTVTEGELDVTAFCGLMNLTGKAGNEAVAVVEAWRVQAAELVSVRAELESVRSEFEAYRAGVEAAKAEAEAARVRSEAVSLIDAAVADGRLPPSRVDGAQSMFTKFGLEALRAHLDAFGIVPMATSDERRPQKPAPRAPKVTDELMHIARLMNKDERWVHEAAELGAQATNPTEEV